MWLYLLQGIVYGFAAASQPGPLQTYLITQTLARGWKRTLPAALAPLISDGPIIVICLFLLNQVPAWMERFLYLASGLFILYLAYSASMSWRGFHLQTPHLESTQQRGLLKAAVLNVLNPNPYIYWTLVTGPILLAGWREAPANGIGFLAGFYLTLIGGLAAIILVFGTAAKLGPKVNRALLGISAIALFCFGLYQLLLGFMN